MTSPASSRTCPECGKPLPPATADQPRPVCAVCLLAQAIASGTAFDPASPSSTARQAPPPPPTPEQIADKFPQFEILSCLGRGGMGVVYKARQKSLKRLVAIKILAPEREHDARFAERFAREAELLAKLSHPHIVTIHDFGETGGLFYLVMEFVDGVNLRDLIRDGKLEARQALAIVPPICEALQYAHEKGIVHRDIKPENLLLDREGRVKIADFGIAALVGSDGTGPGNGASERVGTPPYMAPEQSGAKPAADHRADIYALGVVLYEMLTGERPASDVVAPSRKVQIDVRLDEIVLRALEKSPALRYQTAGEFRTVLETMTAPAPAPSATISEPAPTAALRPAEASRFSRTAIMGALLAGISVLGWPMIDGLRQSIPGASGPGITISALLRTLLLDVFPLSLVLGHIAATALGWIAVVQIRRSSGRLRGLGLALFAGLFFPLLAFDTAVALPIISQLRNEGLNYPDQSAIPVHGYLLSLLRLLALAALPLSNALFIRAIWRRLTGTGSFARLITVSCLATSVALLVAGLNLVNTSPARSSLRGVSYGDEAAILAAANASPHLRPERVRSLPDGPWVAQLPDGGSVELLAVRLHPADGQPWLRPDGTASDYDAKIGRESTGSGGGAIHALARVHYLHPAPSWPNPDGRPARVYNSLKNSIGFASRDGQRLPIADFVIMEFPLDSVTSIQSGETTLRLDVATAGWQTLAGEEPGWWKDLTADAKSTRREWSFSETATGSAQVTVTHLIESPTMEYRFMAVDLDGVEHPATRIDQRRVITDISSTYTAGFNLKGGQPLRLRRVLAVLLQGRPCEAVEFRHVSLRADHRTTVEIQDFAQPGADPELTQTEIIAIAADGALSVAGEPCPPEQLPERIQKLAASRRVEVNIQVNNQAAPKWVALVLRACEKSKLRHSVTIKPKATPEAAGPMPEFKGQGTQLSPLSLVLEESPTLSPASDGPLVSPQFPLESEAVGYADWDGQFHPVMYLAEPHPRGGSEGGAELNVRDASASVTFDLYRGTHPLATANHFLGRYEITRTPADAQLRLGFALNAQGQLLLHFIAEKTKPDGGAEADPHAVLRGQVLRRAAPPGARAGNIRYTRSETEAAEELHFPASALVAAASSPATATLVSTYEQDLRWRWRVVKTDAGRIRYGVADSDADGVLGTICPNQLTDRPDLQTNSPPTTDLVLTVTKSADQTSLRIEDEFFPPMPDLPQQLSAVIPKETWREITCQRAPVALSFTSYQTLWEADVIRHSADGSFTAHRRLRFIARLIGPNEPDDFQMLGDDDPVKTILPIVATHSPQPAASAP